MQFASPQFSLAIFTPPEIHQIEHDPFSLYDIQSVETKDHGHASNLTKQVRQRRRQNIIISLLMIRPDREHGYLATIMDHNLATIFDHKIIFPLYGHWAACHCVYSS